MTGPLAGKRVVNTRAREQASDLDKLLRAEGAVPIPFPCIAIEPAPEPHELDAALGAVRGGAYDWVLITSSNTVRAIEARQEATGRRLAIPASCRIAAVGRATARDVARLTGRPVDLVPARQDAAALAAELPDPAGMRILIPGSSLSRPGLAETLRQRGADITVVTAYRTVPVTPDGDVRSILETCDAISFASPSAVASFAAQLAASGVEPEALRDVIVACIGPTTLAAARERRFPNPLMAEESSLNGIIHMLRAAFEQRSDREGQTAL